MSSLLHIDSYTKYNDVVNELQDYILDDENIKKSLRFKLQKDSQYNKDNHYNKGDKGDNHYNKGDKQDKQYKQYKQDKQDKQNKSETIEQQNQIINDLEIEKKNIEVAYIENSENYRGFDY